MWNYTNRISRPGLTGRAL